MIAHINIGSNLGHRAEVIGRAVSLLGAQLGPVAEVSAPFHSPAWGFESANDFINVGVNVETTLEPDAIVGLLRRIEQQLNPGGRHRDAAGSYVDRLIDLDLISLGNRVHSSPVAMVPHPRMHLREFVLVPMAEILPGWKHPQMHMSVEKMLLDLRNKPGDACV